MNRQELIEEFAKGPAMIREALDKLPREMWDWKPAPDKWSVHQIIIHLPDSEASGYVRCRKLIAEPESVVCAYNQEVFADKLNYHRLDIETALDLFRLMREMTVQLLRTLDDSVWTNTIIHPEHGSVDLNWWLGCYAEHAGKHVKQMQRNLAEWEAAGRPPAQG